MYVGINLALYVALRRRLTSLTYERGIFWYHALSSAGLITVGFAVAVMDPSAEIVAGLIGGTALHGIYSRSFLELWSLTEGSYSLSILEHVEQTTRRGQAVDVRGLECLGAAKKEQRLGSLERLGLVRDACDQVALTDRGRLLADVLAMVAQSATGARTE